MRVLIFHGYLLRGTGSNVYNASLAAALARLGHEVHLVCQERDPPDLDAGAPGSVTVHTPEIGGLLPVFVHDEYEGFRVKTFSELTDAELDGYLSANVAAIRELVDELGGVDATLANHLVMGPVVLARAGLRYALKVHGSDLSYTILPELERFRPYAEEAVSAANGILVGSGHIAARLAEAVGDSATAAKVRLGPPGVDTTLFSPIAPPDRPESLRHLARRLRALGDAGSGGGSWDRDPLAAAQAVEWFADASGPRAVFVGKLIVSKGVDLLLAAWPLVAREHPGARLLVVGFGALEEAVRGVLAGFAEGDLAPLRRLAQSGRALEGGPEGRLSMLSAFLARPPAGYESAARAAASGVRLAGRLEHEEVAAPVAAADVLVFPSTFPEAFGMVAAEAAAAGTPAVSADHSGAAEVSRELAGALDQPLGDLVSFELGDDAVAALAARIEAWLSLAPSERVAAGAALRGAVERLWSWEGVARGVLAASDGRLEELPRPVLA